MLVGLGREMITWSVNFFKRKKKSNTGTSGLANQMTVELKESHKELTEGAG